MFKIKTGTEKAICPPTVGKNDTELCAHGQCKECHELFNRLPIERRAWALLRFKMKHQRWITYHKPSGEMSQSWGLAIAKDARVREQGECFSDGWAVFIELGRRMVVIGKRCEI